MNLFSLLKASLIAASILLLSQNGSAQIVNCNVFMQGHYVEMAVGPNGAYGSTTNAPVGYHNNVSQTFLDLCGDSGTVATLGFVADPAMDGWTVGSPAYFGDYYMPGYPQEGWAIQVANRITKVYMANFTTGPSGYSDTTITGGNTSYTDSAGILKTVWQGVWSSPAIAYGTVIDTILAHLVAPVTIYDTLYLRHNDSIQITQVTILDTNNLFFTTSVTFTNLLDSPTDNIYYARTVDPDNDVEEPGGDYTTFNQVIDTLPGAVVTATGLSSPLSQLALCTIDTNAKAFIVHLDLAPSDPMLGDYYNGTALDGIFSGSDTNDEGIGLVFNIGSLSGSSSTGSSGAKTTSAGNSKTITYAYAFGADAVIQALTDQLPLSTAVNNVTAPEVKVYPNPFNSQLSITGLTSADRLELYDVMGRKMEMNGSINNGGTSTFTITDAPAAHYILEVTDKQGNVKTRVPVQKL